MKRKSPTGSKPTRIAWHPAFFEALQMELNDYRHVLEFHPEYQLTYEPLKIDCVVIKKIKNIQIEKNIATIFREWNIIEYKSPTDYVSVEDFYKVYAYACFYAALNKVSITSMTITFVENRYPKKLLTHLCKILGYTVEESDNGIYTVNGNIIPIQIIDRNKLSLDENVWLRGLSDRLDFSVFNRVTTEATRQKKATRISAYLNTVMLANLQELQEVTKMNAKKLTAQKILEDAGWIAEWEAKGEEQKALKIAKNMLKLGFPVKSVISATELAPNKVKALATKRC